MDVIAGDVGGHRRLGCHLLRRLAGLVCRPRLLLLPARVMQRSQGLRSRLNVCVACAYAARRAPIAACAYSSNRSHLWMYATVLTDCVCLFSELNYGQQNEDVDMIRELQF
jgi:hypothetical protein